MDHIHNRGVSMKIKLATLGLLFLASTTQAFTVSDLFDASTNGSGWTGETATSQIIKTPGATAGTNEWFSRYTINNGESEFNINAGILADFKNAPMQDQSGAGLIATSSTVRATFLGTGAARDSFLFLAQAGSANLNTANFWNPVYASGGTNSLGTFNPVNSSNVLFETRGGCTYAEAKAGNTCTPTNLGQSREISGLTAGDNLIFGLQALVLHHNADNIHYNNTNYFFSGQAANNKDAKNWNDGKVHTKILNLGDNKYLVGFEDIWGGGDGDFNDNVFLFEGVMSNINLPPVTVPEPNLLSLLLLGLVFLFAKRIRSRSQQ